jgi:hypothetical protein
MRLHRTSQGRKNKRRGAALVELAVCLPVLVLLVMGVIEACSMIYLRQSLKIAAYEAARVAMVPGSSAGNIEGQAYLILDSRRIRGWSIEVTPADRTTLVPGDFVRVNVSAPCEPNSLLTGWFYRGRTFQQSVELMMEL